MRIAVEEVVAEDRLEDEAEEHDARAVPEFLRLRLQPLEVVAACARRRQHARAAPLHDDARHTNERIGGEQAGEGRLIRGFSAVVELLGDPRLQLRRERLRIEPGIQHAEHAVEPRQVRHVGADRVVDARVLHLHDDLLAVRQPRGVDLADARGREWRGLEVGEEPVEWLAEVGFDDPAREVEGHRRRRGLELLQGGPILLRHVVGDEARDLRELHDGALHVADDGEDVLGVAEVGCVGDGLPSVGACEQRPEARPELPHRELRGEKPDAGGPTELGAENRRGWNVPPEGIRSQSNLFIFHISVGARRPTGRQPHARTGFRAPAWSAPPAARVGQ